MGAWVVAATLAASLACRDAVDCTRAGRAALKSCGISAASAKLLVEELGYSEAGDLVHITQAGQEQTHKRAFSLLCSAAQTCITFKWRGLIMPR